jgi:hypothetical protein
MHDEKELKWFDRMNVKRPAHFLSDLEDTKENPLHKQLTRLRCSNWRIEGNVLKCDTPEGPLSQTVNTDVICLGTDDNGLPILREVV